MREAVLEGMSFCMVLLLGLCADGLAERPGGLVVLLVGMLLSGVPLILSRLWDFGHCKNTTEKLELLLFANFDSPLDDTMSIAFRPSCR